MLKSLRLTTAPFVILLALMSGCSTDQTKATSPSPTTGNETDNLKTKPTQVITEEQNPHEKVVEAYFQSVLNGSGSSQFWCKEDEWKATSLFTVRSYNVLDRKDSAFGEDGKWYIVQIESSTQGGLPIVANWQLGIQKETDTENAKKIPGGYCVSDLIEHQ